MNHKTTMPEPVAKVIQRTEWGDAPAFIGNGKPHPPTGTLLITTDQAEAYADAKVREALEKAESIVQSNTDAQSEGGRMNTEQERADFEAWYVDYFIRQTGKENFTTAILSTMRGDEGDYREYLYLHGAWDGYRAGRAALQSPEVQELLDALQEVVDAADGDGWNVLDPSFEKQRAALAAMEKQK